MRAVVGYRGGDDGGEALALAVTLRRTTSADLIVVAVLPLVSDHPGIERVDLEYRTWLAAVAAEARVKAAAVLAAGDPAALDFREASSTSVAAGLVDVAEATDADVLLLGCARTATRGSFLMSSVADRLLHSSPVPVLLAPHGYINEEHEPFASMTCAFVGTEQSREALVAACDLAVRYGTRLRVATFVPRAATMYPPEVGMDAEDMVSAEVAERAVRLHEEAVALCRARGVDDVATVVGRGQGWAGALTSIEWGRHDLLIFGSSRLGQLARVFLGSTASKIMRASPVPVLIIPSGTTTWST